MEKDFFLLLERSFLFSLEILFLPFLSFGSFLSFLSFRSFSFRSRLDFVSNLSRGYLDDLLINKAFVGLERGQ